MLWLMALAPLIMMGSYPHYQCPLRDWPFVDDWKHITTLLESVCSSKPEAFETIMTSWHNGIHCWSMSSIKENSRSFTWCNTDNLEKAQVCIKNMTAEWQPYLNSEETFITDFMVSGHKQAMEQLCKDGEDGLTDQLERNDKKHCENNIGDMIIDAIVECTSKAPFYQENKNIDVVMNKSDFCSNFHTTTKCIVDYLEAHCTGRDFSSFLNTIFESHFDWCKKNI